MSPVGALYRVGAPLLCAALVAAAPSARAADAGTIEGRVVNRGTGRPQAGVEVVLRGGRGGTTPERSSVERRATTDGRGRFHFSGLAVGEDRLYTLDARFDGGLFAGRALSLPPGPDPPVIDATIRVWPTTADPRAISFERDSLFLLPGDGGAAAIESVRVVNSSSRAYIGRGAGRGSGGGGPSLAFALPASAELAGTRIVASSLDIPDIVSSDVGGFGITVAIPPGTSTVTFTYPLVASTGRFDLTRRALYPILELAVLAGEPLTVEGDLLRPDGSVDLQGRTYRRWSAPKALEPGDAVQAEAFAEAGMDPLLLGGLAFLALAAAAVAGGALLRRRRGAGAASTVPAPPRGRTALLEQIAELDLRHRAGEVSDAEWAERRAQLKDRLAQTGEREPEPAP